MILCRCLRREDAKSSSSSYNNSTPRSLRLTQRKIRRMLHLASSFSISSLKITPSIFLAMPLPCAPTMTSLKSQQFRLLRNCRCTLILQAVLVTPLLSIQFMGLRASPKAFRANALCMEELSCLTSQFLVLTMMHKHN